VTGVTRTQDVKELVPETLLLVLDAFKTKPTNQ